MMKRLVLVPITILVLTFAGCSRQMPAASTEVSTPASNEKVGKTTKTGEVVLLNDKTFLQESGQTPIEIDSYNVDLKSHVGQIVTVTGEYSGNTLFVGELK